MGPAAHAPARRSGEHASFTPLEVTFTDQLAFTDGEFLAQLRLPGPAGRRLARTIRDGDSAAAMALVGQWFRTRAGPRWFAYTHGTPWHETEAPGGVLARAEGLMRGELRNHWPPHQVIPPLAGGSDIDWPAAVSAAPSGAGRHTFVGELSTAFALTGEIRFAHRAFALMRDAVLTGMPFVLDPRFYEDHDMYFGGPGNPTLTVGYRVFRWIDFLHCGAAQAAGVLTDADVAWIVKQLCFWAAQFHRLCGDGMRPDNHHLVDHGHVPFVLGTMFPEFAFARELATRATAVIRWHCGRNLLADGSYAEHSANYQYHVLYHFLHPLGLARANGVRLFDARQLARLRGWAEFQAYACQPDGSYVAIGDETGRRLAYFFGHLASPILDARMRAMAEALGFATGGVPPLTPAAIAKAMRGWKPGSRLGVGLAPWFLAAPRPARAAAARGLPPPSRRYPVGGWTFMRSGWTPDADYLAVSHQGTGGHCHWDPMSFVLHTGGKVLIGDPATWIYDTAWFGHGDAAPKPAPGLPPLHRGYSYSVNAHNCLVMNDDTLKPLEAMCHPTFWGGQPPQHGLGLGEFGGPIEVSELWHDANAPTRHRRFVVRIAGIGFAMVDQLARPNLDMRPNQYTQMLHCGWDVEPDAATPEPGAALRLSLERAACVVIPGAECDSRWTAARDRWLQGIYASDRVAGGPDPWVMNLTRRVRGPAVFATLYLANGLAGRIPAAPPRYLGKARCEWFGWQEDGVAATAFDLGEHGSVLIASCPYGRPLSSPELTTDAELAVVVRDRAGRVRSWALARGRELASGGRSLYRGKRVAWRCSPAGRG